jgi:hypothetical protein
MARIHRMPKIGFPGDTDLSGDRTRLPSRRLFQPLNGHILALLYGTCSLPAVLS